MSLKHIKNKIKSTERTSKVTRAMEAVSAVKMRKSQERALTSRPYAESALRILEHVSHASNVKKHYFFSENTSVKNCIIVVTSDKGLAGSLNSAVLKEATSYIQSFQPQDIDCICFGKKSYEHFTRRGFNVPLHYTNVSDDVTLSDLDEVVAFIISNFKNKHYGHVYVVYQSFISTFEQSATTRTVLPFSPSTLQDIVEGIVPTKGKYSDIRLETKPATYTVEPDENTVYDTLFPKLIKIMLYHALLESKASEHSARMVAMKNATDKAKEVTHTLTLAYNKERQSVITAEVSEITAGIEAMK
jgi:F-type H+-transporting ATPase subunit gamma